ncbi:unnamed protein product [Caenorhabditis auriculariae]|uniref:Chitinase domain-containing protein 1 n=1 Tax=Caenorhabditis auriculariae TaxID=2777116 RepID=A0A8S1HMT8_9PELO|nr:unnamed protein product [Caenorhabditis auriculariae]
MLRFIPILALAISLTEQVVTPELVPERNYRFPVDDITVESIIKESGSLSKEEAEKRNFKNPVLAYVAPWNTYGYDLAKKTAKKLTHVSPIWFKARPYRQNGALQCKVEGSPDIDRSFMEALKAENWQISIVPLISFEKWGVEAPRFLRDTAAQTRCAHQIVDFLTRNEFDGAVLNMFTTFSFVTRAASPGYKKMIYEAMEEFAQQFTDKSLEVIFSMVPSINSIFYENDAFSGTDFQRLTDMSTFLEIDLFGIPLDDELLEVSPYDWLYKGLKHAENGGANMSRVLMGTHFFGYQNTDPMNFPSPDSSLGEVANKELMEKLKSGKVDIKWDADIWEHAFVHKETVIYYPTLSSLERKFKLAEHFHVGVAIWEYGQGLDYFARVF